MSTNSFMMDPRDLESNTVCLPPGTLLDPLALAMLQPAVGGFLFYGSKMKVASSGVAATFNFPDGIADSRAVSSATRWLPSIAKRGASSVRGTGPLLLGALPFDRNESACLFVPEITYSEDRSGNAWITLVDGPNAVDHLPTDPDKLLAALAERLTGVDEGGSHLADYQVNDGKTFTNEIVKLFSIPDEQEFLEAIRSALGSIADGVIDKVVLARRIEATLRREIDPAGVVRRLSALEPSSTVFAVMGPDGAFVGASPELLIAREGAVVSSHPLAGTVPLTGEPDADDKAVARLAASSKEQAEHQSVVDAVGTHLGSWCTEMQIPSSPAVLRLRTVAHLGTLLTGRLNLKQGADPTEGPTALRLASELHPTPAVAGTPRNPALEAIGLLEHSSRGLYAGPVGWVDASGDGEFVIGIRSAELKGRIANVHAGVGIVAGSDPEQELAETTAKLRTAVSALT